MGDGAPLVDIWDLYTTATEHCYRLHWYYVLIVFSSFHSQGRRAKQNRRAMYRNIFFSMRHTLVEVDSNPLVA